MDDMHESAALAPCKKTYQQVGQWRNGGSDHQAEENLASTTWMAACGCVAGHCPAGVCSARWLGAKRGQPGYLCGSGRTEHREKQEVATVTRLAG